MRAMLDAERLQKAVFVATRSLRWTLNEAARERPDWLRDAAFHDEKARLFDRLWAG